MQQVLGTKPQVFLELHTRPYRYMRNPQGSCGLLDPSAIGVRNSATRDELEGIWRSAYSIDGLGHVALGFRQRERVPVRALDDGLACRLAIKQFDARDVPPLIASRLAVPNQVTPAGAHVICKDKALELNTTVVLEVDRRNRHRCHAPALFT